MASKKKISGERKSMAHRKSDMAGESIGGIGGEAWRRNGVIIEGKASMKMKVK
jgi:hypothetical protein